MKRDEIIERLVRASERRAAALDERQAAADELAKLIPLAQRAGVGATEITRLTGLSRRAVYDVLDGIARR
jgi:myo-inositol catabolism protein IolC